MRELEHLGAHHDPALLQHLPAHVRESVPALRRLARFTGELFRTRLQAEQAEGAVRGATDSALELAKRSDSVARTLGFRNKTDAKQKLLGWGDSRGDQPTVHETREQLRQRIHSEMPSHFAGVTAALEGELGHHLADKEFMHHARAIDFGARLSNLVPVSSHAEAAQASAMTDLGLPKNHKPIVSRTREGRLPESGVALAVDLLSSIHSLSPKDFEHSHWEQLRETVSQRFFRGQALTAPQEAAIAAVSERLRDARHHGLADSESGDAFGVLASVMAASKASWQHAHYIAADPLVRQAVRRVPAESFNRYEHAQALPAAPTKDVTARLKSAKSPKLARGGTEADVAQWQQQVRGTVPNTEGISAALWSALEGLKPIWAELKNTTSASGSQRVPEGTQPPAVAGQQ
jgi:hypothetical protein